MKMIIVFIALATNTYMGRDFILSWRDLLPKQLTIERFEVFIVCPNITWLPRPLPDFLFCFWFLNLFMAEFILFVFLNFEGHQSFFGATDTPDLDFQWRLHFVSKPRHIPCLDGFLRFTSGVTPADPLATSMAGKSFVIHICVMMDKNGMPQPCHGTPLAPAMPWMGAPVPGIHLPSHHLWDRFNLSVSTDSISSKHKSNLFSESMGRHRLMIHCYGSSLPIPTFPTSLLH